VVDTPFDTRVILTIVPLAIVVWAQVPSGALNHEATPVSRLVYLPLPAGWGSDRLTALVVVVVGGTVVLVVVVGGTVVATVVDGGSVMVVVAACWATVPAGRATVVGGADVDVVVVAGGADVDVVVVDGSGSATGTGGRSPRACSVPLRPSSVARSSQPSDSHAEPRLAGPSAVATWMFGVTSLLDTRPRYSSGTRSIEAQRPNA
jgi:hypothetical protein